MASPYPPNTVANAAQNLADETAGLLKMFTQPNLANQAAVTNQFPGAACGQIAGDVITRTFGGPNDNSNLRLAYNITRATLANILDPVVPGPPGIYNPINRRTISLYLQMLCHHVNFMQPHAANQRDRRYRARPADIPIVAHLRNNLYNPPAPAVLGTYAPGNRWYAVTTADLNRNGFGRARMMQMKHILWPISLPASAAIVPPRLIAHEILVVISPIGKTVDYLTSEPGGIVNGAIAPSDMHVIQHISILLADHLGRDFCPQQWKLRVNGSSLHDHPNHSALWVMSNAMRIVFGYTLADPPAAARNYEHRRLKMASEIMWGHFDERDPPSAGRPLGWIFSYPMINRDPWLSRSGPGWKPMNRAWIKNHLPVRRMTTWRAQNETKATLKHKCQTTMTAANRRRFNRWRMYLKHPFLDGYKDYFENTVRTTPGAYPPPIPKQIRPR